MPLGNPTPTNATVDSVSSLDVLMMSATVDTGFQMMIALLVGTQWGKSSIARHVAQCLVPYLAAALFTLVLWMLEFVIGFFEDGVGWYIYHIGCALTLYSWGFTKDRRRRRSGGSVSKSGLALVGFYLAFNFMPSVCSWGWSFVQPVLAYGLSWVALPFQGYYNPLAWLVYPFVLGWQFAQWTWYSPSAGLWSIGIGLVTYVLWAVPLQGQFRIISSIPQWLTAVATIASTIFSLYLLLSWWWTDSHMSPVRTVWAVLIILGTCFLTMGAAFFQETVMSRRLRNEHDRMGLRRIETPWGQTLWWDQMFTIIYRIRSSFALVALTWVLRTTIDRWYIAPAIGVVLAALGSILLLNQFGTDSPRESSMIWCTPLVRTCVLMAYLVPFLLMLHSDFETEENGDVTHTLAEGALDWSWLKDSWLVVSVVPSITLVFELGLAATLPVMLFSQG